MKYNRENTIKEYMACGGILDVLKAVQAGEGYISEEAIEDIAKAYGKFPSEVYETATFYTMLSVGHRADHMVEVCGSTCCDAGDAKAVMDAISERSQKTRNGSSDAASALVAATRHQTQL